MPLQISKWLAVLFENKHGQCLFVLCNYLKSGTNKCIKEHNSEIVKQQWAIWRVWQLLVVSITIQLYKINKWFMLVFQLNTHSDELVSMEQYYSAMQIWKQKIYTFV